MMFLVEKGFVDKETKKLHDKGTIYETLNETRVEELRKKGFLGVELVIKEEAAPEPTEELDKEEKAIKAKK